MKKFVKTITLLFYVLVPFTLISAQESDYEVQIQFSEQYAEIEKALKSVSSTNHIDSLRGLIFNLESDNISHQNLLDNALYPASFQSKMELLKDQTNSVEQKILIIENQNDRLSKLSTEMTYYKSEIDLLTVRTDSLKRAIASSMDSEERLSKLVKNYRTSLEQRDELILNVIDSLLVSYKGMVGKVSQENLNEASGTVSTDGNPLAFIQTIIDENTEWANTNTNTLSVEDHLRMYAVQNHFANTWELVGDKMLQAYGGNNRNEWKIEINSGLKDWRMATSQKMWKSMDQYLEFSSVELDAFDNKGSFFNALDNFIANAQEKSKTGILTSKNYEEYREFEKFWSAKVKNEWSNLIQDAEILTVSQISSIDQKLDTWEVESRPIHPLLIVFIVITITALAGFIFVMYKSQITT